MKPTLRSPLFTGLLVLGIALPTAAAWAQAGTSVGEQIRVEHCGMDGQCTPVRKASQSKDHAARPHGQHMEKRLTRLGERLKLTTAQQPAWDTFRTALKTQAEKHRLPQPRPETRPATALERIVQHEQHLQARLDELRTQRQAVEQFYNQLSNEQKSIFDKEFATPPRPEGHGRKHADRHHGPRSGKAHGKRIDEDGDGDEPPAPPHGA